MTDKSPANFYDELANHYHLIFDDWEASIHRQALILSALLPTPDIAGKVLDCACGIGTQALALAISGFQVDGCDISKEEIARAKTEAKIRNLDIQFWVDDMRKLSGANKSNYGSVLCMDNSIPHLSSDDDIILALSAMRDRLRNGGYILLSLRDYEKILRERPAFTPPKITSTESDKRIVFQMWEWLDDRRYEVHLHINELKKGVWTSRHSVGQYRAITPNELVALADQAGLSEIEVLNSDATGFYQPIIRARLQA